MFFHRKVEKTKNTNRMLQKSTINTWVGDTVSLVKIAMKVTVFRIWILFHFVSMDSIIPSNFYLHFFTFCMRHPSYVMCPHVSMYSDILFEIVALMSCFFSSFSALSALATVSCRYSCVLVLRIESSIIRCAGAFCLVIKLQRLLRLTLYDVTLVRSIWIQFYRNIYYNAVGSRSFWSS